MSQNYTDTLRAVYDEWAKGNFRAGTELYDSLLLFVPFPDFPAEPHYVGPEGVRQFMLAFLAAWTDLTMTAEQFIEAGDSIVVVTRWRGVGKESGALTERLVFDVWTFRGPTVVRAEFFSDRGEALAAVGLPEQDADAGP
jgi:ketosteroid isomerase-like protein